MSSSPKGRARKGVVSLLSSLVVAMLLLFGLASPASAAELVFVEPPEVTWVDLCGVDSDTYTIPPSDEVAYLVDGMTTEPGTYPGEVGETTVEAVLIVEDNEEFWYLLDGTTTWYLSFTDEPCVGDPAGDLNASSSTCETISVSYANITPEGAAVEIRVDGETVTGDVVDVEAGEYSVELVVNGVVVDSVTVSVSECPVDPGPKPNPVVEQVVVESDPDCVSRTVTVTTTTTTTDWELSSDGTQWVEKVPVVETETSTRPATDEECPPTVDLTEITVPVVPIIDPCGPDNAVYGEVPDGEYSVLPNEDGGLTLVANEGFIFPNAQALVVLPAPVDSNEPCLPEPPENVVENLEEFRVSCEGIEHRTGEIITGWVWDDESRTYVPGESSPPIWGTWDFIATQDAPENIRKEFEGLTDCDEPPTIDVCPNIDGDQAELPEGYEIDDAGNCVEVEEASVECPSGETWTDANGNGEVDEGECGKGPQQPEPPKEPQDPPAKPAAPGSPGKPGGALPRTGSETSDLVTGALVLLLGGGVLVVVARRRRLVQA